jgi:hypothetical protein
VYFVKVDDDDLLRAHPTHVGLNNASRKKVATGKLKQQCVNGLV